MTGSPLEREIDAESCTRRDHRKNVTKHHQHDREKPMTHYPGGLMRRLCVSLCLAVLPLSSVADDFYRDRTITFIIGSAPGGGYDAYSRLVASHLGRHIGGQPTIVPQNLPGAGSIRAANYLYSIAPKDGTTLGMVDEAILLNQILGVQEPTTDATKLSWFGGIVRRIMGTSEVRTDAIKFNWIGRILANSAILFVRREVGVQKIEDAVDKELIVSASGTASKLNWTVLKNAFGMKFKIVSGYQGSNESLLALMRGEADALSMPWSILRITGAELIRDKKINLLLQTGTEKDADLGNLPRMIDLARNDDERKLLELFASPSTIGRSVLAPPGTPMERVAELRHAFMAMTQDPTFLSDLKKARLELSPLSGERLQAAVASMGDVPDWLIKRARRVSEAVGN
jgi:tripartite-type tricarboxylate transporter receptor subunit TctC